MGLLNRDSLYRKLFVLSLDLPMDVKMRIWKSWKLALMIDGLAFVPTA